MNIDFTKVFFEHPEDTSLLSWRTKVCRPGEQRRVVQENEDTFSWTRKYRIREAGGCTTDYKDHAPSSSPLALRTRSERLLPFLLRTIIVAEETFGAPPIQMGNGLDTSSAG